MKFDTNKSYYIQASRRCGKTTLLSKILVKNIIKNLKSKEELTFMVVSFSLPSLNNLKVMVEKELTKKLTKDKELALTIFNKTYIHVNNIKILFSLKGNNPRQYPNHIYIDDVEFFTTADLNSLYRDNLSTIVMTSTSQPLSVNTWFYKDLDFVGITIPLTKNLAKQRNIDVQAIKNSLPISNFNSEIKLGLYYDI